MTLKPGDVRTVRIDAMDDEGRGRASSASEGGGDELDLCVRGAFIGDLVEAQVERAFPTSGVAQARALHVIEEGPTRVPRTCTHSAPCPGCPLHGLEGHLALDLKVARIRRALDDAGVSAPIAAVQESESPRQKVKLVVEGGRVGLYVPHTHELRDADRCPYHHPDIERALTRLRPHLAAPIKAVIARAFREGVGVSVVCSEAPRGDLARALQALVDGADSAPVVSLTVRIDRSGGNSLLGGDVLRVHGPQHLTPLDGGPLATVDAFCQPDASLAQRMSMTAAGYLLAPSHEISKPHGVFADLYAGTGAFSRALLSAGAAEVVAVERADTSAPSLARIAHVTPIASSVEDALGDLFQRHRTRPFLGLVADPPRKGLAGAARPLAVLGVPRVALVACDPDAGARDARVLVDAGYALEQVVPFDLFPGTPDVEALMLFERR